MSGRNQQATLWRSAGFDDYGHPTFSAAVNFKCRWQGVAKLFQGADGAQFVSESVVYPDRVQIKNGDFIALGANADFGDAKEVRYSGFSPSSLANYTVYKVAL